MLTDNLPSGEIVFDSIPKLSPLDGNWSLWRREYDGLASNGPQRSYKMTQWNNCITVINQFPLF